MAIMTDQPTPPESYIVIRFAAAGATFMNVTNHNVYPGQLVVAGDYLLQEGRRLMEMLRQQQEQEAESTKIAKPTSKIIVPK